MYRTFVAKNFRCLRDLRMDDLGRINLITGQNNAGKTTLLEALFLHIGSHNAQLSMTIAGWRGMESFPPDYVWRLMFRDLNIDETIEFISTDNLNVTRTLRVRKAQSGDIELSAEEFAPAKSVRAATTEAQLQGLVGEYEDSSGNKGQSRLLLQPGGGVLMRQPPIPQQPVGVFLSSKADLALAPEQYTALERKRRESYLLEALQTIEPNLKRLSVGALSGQTAMLADVGLPEPVPVAVLGGGLVRLLSMLLAVPAVPGGYVMIDEIENGLHYSVLPKAWEAIAEAARASNVQVFATTHSLECVRAAHAAFPGEGAPDLRVHRLERVAEKVTAVTLDGEALQASADFAWEVR